MQKKLLLFLLLNCLVIGVFMYRFGGELAVLLRQKLAVQFYNTILDTYAMGFSQVEQKNSMSVYRDVEAAVFPVFSYHEQLLWYESQMEDWADYENFAAAKQQQLELLTSENAMAEQESESGTGEEEDLQNAYGGWDTATVGMEGEEIPPQGDGENQPAGNEEWEENGQTAAGEEPENTVVADGNPDKTVEASTPAVGSGIKQVVINREKLQDFDYLRQNFYVVDNSTTIGGEQLNAALLLGKDMKLDESIAEGPQILIYHTHSQEGYLDSVEGDSATSVVAVGEYLTKLLTEQYGFRVLHHTGEYDVGDRDHAYSNAAPAIGQVLAQNPSIQVVIDLHRDSVNENTHLLTEINGKPTAKIMFFNGLCRTTKRGELTSLPNPYLEDNLAFSLQMQIAACEYYPEFTRHIYLKGYRYNMHFCPKSLLVEVGAQNNTLEEAMNAMEPLAELLAKVLLGM